MSKQGANVNTDNGIAEFLGKNGKLNGSKTANGTELSWVNWRLWLSASVQRHIG